MKRLVICCLILFCNTHFIESQTKKEKKQELITANYNKTKALIASKNYEFKGDWMYPLGSKRVSLIGNMNKLTITDDRAKSQLPFVGTRQFASGGNPGIVFDGTIDDYSVNFDDETKSIEVYFSLSSGNENYKVTLRITSNGYTRVNVASNKRNSISYSGLIDIVETSN